ncbi:MAG: TIGR00645 family protein [Hyphomicrobium sp.]|nr:MAG: TIGR00645 family protein [Hyphomicrobium sp.]
MVKRAEIFLENLLFSARWLLAPFYFGLAVSLFILLIKFLMELFHLAEGAFTSTESDVILGLLTLVDLTLTGSLLIIVVFSGYENFVSRMDHSNHDDRPEWMGTIDFSALKLKMLSSIVAISAVQLLRQFMSLGTVTPEREKELMWLVVIHLVFVVSSVLLALSDWIAGGSHGEASEAPEKAGNGSKRH